jgi:hypothetical protein
MQRYAAFTSNIAVEAERDPISFEEFELKDDAHPRSVITLRGSNGVPRAYYTETVIQMIDHNLNDPFTRQPFTELVKKRARLYLRAMQEFPDYKIADLEANNLFQRWLSTYSDAHDMSNEEVAKIRLEAECFLQAEDLAHMFATYDGSGSMNNRGRAISDLSQNEYASMNDLSWILRKCSVQDTQYDKAYALSRRVGDGMTHTLIIHRIGEGFYYNVFGISRGELASQEITGYTSSHPTILDILKDFL